MLYAINGQRVLSLHHFVANPRPAAGADGDVHLVTFTSPANSAHPIDSPAAAPVADQDSEYNVEGQDGCDYEPSNPNTGPVTHQHSTGNE